MIQQGSGQLPRYDPPLAHRFSFKKLRKTWYWLVGGLKHFSPNFNPKPFQMEFLALNPSQPSNPFNPFHGNPQSPSYFDFACRIWLDLIWMIGQYHWGCFFAQQLWSCWAFLGENSDDVLGGWWNFEGDLSLSFQIKALGGFQKKSNVIWKWKRGKPV